MQALIEDLLAFARLGGELRRVTVDLAAVVAEVREDLGATLDRRGRRRWATLPVGAPATRSSCGRCCRTSSPTPPSSPGPASRRGSRSSPPSGRPAAGGSRSPTTASAIPAEQRDRVFEPLARVDETRRGLRASAWPPCAGWSRRTAATVGLDETPGGGTTVWFELPDR